MGAATEALRRATDHSQTPNSGSILLSDANIRRLVEKLSRMRGAALKVGQFLSIQGDAHARQVQITPDQRNRRQDTPISAGTDFS